MVLRRTFLALAIVSAYSHIATAATNGSLGTTSVGTIQLSAEISDLVNVSRLDDINVGSLSASNLSAIEDFCVYRNGTGNYQITVTGSGPGNTFSVSDGALALPFDVDVNSTSVTSGTALTGQTGANTTSILCGGTDNASIEVSFSATNIAAANQGTYTGSLTITVAPE